MPHFDAKGEANAEFTKALARQLHRPAFLPAPYFGLRLAFGEFACRGVECEPRLLDEGGASDDDARPVDEPFDAASGDDPDVAVLRQGEAAIARGA